jgi:hypothetical protein
MRALCKNCPSFMMALTKTNTMRGLVILHAADGIIPSYPLLKKSSTFFASGCSSVLFVRVQVRGGVQLKYSYYSLCTCISLESKFAVPVPLDTVPRRENKIFIVLRNKSKHSQNNFCFGSER